ncbi:gliding motility-associated protein GldE [Marivirga arenosa]|uniref:Gliding motility-associated protein GldE n=1 Tax=Marivirga arenosa TaxID=3059076 RepID=A0AA51ZWN8_9BACT|nr:MULTISPECIES: gliding motility-associated protein GldE [unclassified Marivirga]WKK86803.2 gliding motility-associated protein GldE [Marivirga sp. ABR2-2]WNB18107.1 gliding motility-associated protein GldE [Marivirga sp. BKB1-2]
MEDPFPSILILTSLAESGNHWFYIINILLMMFLLLMSALVSGSEVAFFSLSHEDLAKCKVSSSPKQQTILELLKNPKRLLATILILNNFINVAIVTLSTYVTWEIVGTKETEGLLVVSLTAIITFLIVFYGEIVPKVYANQNNLSFATRMSLALNFSAKIFSPLSISLMSISNIIEKRVEQKGFSVSLDELHHALEITADKDTTEEEKGILKGIVNFGTLSVRQVMRSRLDITAFDIEDDYHKLMDQINKSGFSRIPVYCDTIDKIEGILYVKDLLPYIEKEEDFEWQKLLRPGFFVPESKKVDSLLKDFQEKRVHMAIVVDEYGGTSGLITLEDVIEEIVGEINDEFDEDVDVAYNKLDDYTYIFEGRTSLNDFCKIINEEVNVFDEVKGESESLGGLLLELNSKLPRTGEKIKYKNFTFTVVAVDQKRIKRVRVFTKN